MIRVWMGMAAPLALLALTFGWSGPSYGIPVSDEESQGIVGGAADCANKWKSGSVACASGTVLCGSQAQQCSTQTFTSLVTDGAGNEVLDQDIQRNCKVCSLVQCSTVRAVTRTKAADCDME